MKETPGKKRRVVAVIATGAMSGRSELRGISDAARRLDWMLETIDPAEVGSDLARMIN